MQAATHRTRDHANDNVNDNVSFAAEEHRWGVNWIASNFLAVAEGEREVEYALTNAIDAIRTRSSKATEFSATELDRLLSALRAARRGAAMHLDIDPLTLQSGFDAAEAWLKYWAAPAATRGKFASMGGDAYTWLKILRNVSHTAALRRDIAGRPPLDLEWLP